MAPSRAIDDRMTGDTPEVMTGGASRTDSMEDGTAGETYLPTIEILNLYTGCTSSVEAEGARSLQTNRSQSVMGKPLSSISHS